MKVAFSSALVLALAFSGSPCLPEDAGLRERIISEDEVRFMSARRYTAILITACKNGWRYPLKQLESGFKRHLNELKLQLLNDGYIVVAPHRSGHDDKSSALKVILAGNSRARWAGCAQSYWRETRGQDIAPP